MADPRSPPSPALGVGGDGFALALRMLAEEHDAQVASLQAEVARWRAAATRPRSEPAASPGPRALPGVAPRMPPADLDLAPQTPAASSAGKFSKANSIKFQWLTSDVSRRSFDADSLSVEEDDAAPEPSPTLDMIQSALRRQSISSTKSVEEKSEKSMFILDSVIGGAIVVNTMLLGLSADVWPEWFGWILIDAGFAALFLAEFCTKMYLLGPRAFFFGGDRIPNIFETVLVVLAILESGLALARVSGDGGNSSQVLALFRVVRLFRVFRVVRVMRLEIFSELKSMIRGTLGGLRTLLWSTVLIILPVYSVCLILRETVGSIDEVGNGAEYFTSVPNAFFAVFRCIVVGECADMTGRPLFVLITDAYGWGYGFIFCSTAVFMSFGLFNVIVAMFVENVVTAAKSRDRLARKERLRNKYFFAKTMAKLLRVICEIYDKRSDREVDPGLGESVFDRQSWMEITPELFEEMRSDVRVQKLFDDLDLADEDQFSLFDTLDSDKSGTVDLEEFSSGIAKLRGEACRSDIISINLMIQGVRSEMRTYMNSLARRIYRLDDTLVEVRRLQEPLRDTC